MEKPKHINLVVSSINGIIYGAFYKKLDAENFIKNSVHLMIKKIKVL